LTNACNETILQVVWRPDKFGEFGIDVDVLTGNIVSIEPKFEDPREPEAVLIDKSFVDSTTERAEKRFTVVWTETEHYMYDNKEEKVVSVNEGDKNPYGFLPFVYIHRELPTANFWDETSGSDIYECSLIVACLKTLIDIYFVWNSFKQLAIKSVDTPEVVTHSPDTVVHLKGQDDEAHVLDFQVAIKSLIEALREYIVSVVQNYGVDWNSLALKVKEISGKAGKVKSSKLLRIWKNQIDGYEQAEYELAEVIKRVYETHTGKKLDVDLKIEFPFQEIEKEEKDVLANLEKEIEMNMKDVVMAFMERNKGYRNYDDAKKKIMEIIDTNNEIKEKVADPVDVILGKQREKETEE